MTKNNDKDEEILLGTQEDTKNIIVQINEEDFSTTILSDYSPEENIDFLIEAAGANAQELVKQGKDKEEVINELRDFFEQVVEAYITDFED